MHTRDATTIPVAQEQAYLIPKARHERNSVQNSRQTIAFSGCTDPGPRRANNEDAFTLPPAYADQTKLGTLLAVMDGAGGIEGGEIASQCAAAYLPMLYYASVPPEQLRLRLERSIEMTNHLIRWQQQQAEMPNQMLTTLVAAVIDGTHIRIAFVGDSKAYLVTHDGNIKLLTEEHTQHREGVKAGDQLAERYRKSGIITRALGLEDEVAVDIHRAKWTVGDRLILCSDGLDELPQELMRDICLALPPAQAAEELVRQAGEIDGSDNATAIVAAWLA